MTFIPNIPISPKINQHIANIFENSAESTQKSPHSYRPGPGLLVLLQAPRTLLIVGKYGRQKALDVLKRVSRDVRTSPLQGLLPCRSHAQSHSINKMLACSTRISGPWAGPKGLAHGPGPWALPMGHAHGPCPWHGMFNNMSQG